MNRIKHLREEHSMTQTELGKVLNVQGAAMSKYENEKTPLTSDTIKKLAEFFGVSTDYLLCKTDNKDCIIQKDPICKVHMSDRIKLLRTSAGLTQEEFGNIFGIVKSTVSLYESGKSTPNDEIKLKICRYFNVSLDYLIGISNVSEQSSDSLCINNNTNEIGSLIQHYRELNKLTQKELADKLSVSPSTIGMYEQNRRVPDIKMLINMSKIFNISIDTLTGTNGDSSSYVNIAINNQLNSIISLSPIEEKLLDTFKRLNEDNQDIIIGKMKELLKEQNLQY